MSLIKSDAAMYLSDAEQLDEFGHANSDAAPLVNPQVIQ
jgi:hypothetical protein